MLSKVHESWHEFFLLRERQSLETIMNKLTDKQYYPSKSDIFTAFSLPVSEVRVLIIGQDPYSRMDQAHGLAFSVKKGPIPPSLKNVLKEAGVRKHTGDLTAWHEQGVMLLNSILTVEPYKTLSHAHLGWQAFTRSAIAFLLERNPNVVVMLWGKLAQKNDPLFQNKLLVLKTSHPSPLSVSSGFCGCKHFDEANMLLTNMGKDPIEWRRYES